MNPIYEYNPNDGIGYGFEDFLNHFIEICYEHLRNGRAKAFAFILFDFEHGAILDAMKNKKVFTKLDRISGKDLTIFYLNSNDIYSIKRFNDIFGHALTGEKEIQRPAVIFFKIIGNDAESVEYYSINNNKLFAFQEINEYVKDYVSRLNEKGVMKKDFLKSIFKTIKNAGLDYAFNQFFDMLFKK